MLIPTLVLPAIRKGRRLVWLLGPVSLFLSAPAYSQSLGDIARQERERKQSEPAHETHVYDNCDLRKTEILVPEDQERAQAAKRRAAPAGGEPPVESAGNVTSDGTVAEESLGDIARRYRAMKEQLQEADLQADGAGGDAVETQVIHELTSSLAAKVTGRREPLRREVRVAHRAMRAENAKAASRSKGFRMMASAPGLARPAAEPSKMVPAPAVPTSVVPSEPAKMGAAGTQVRMGALDVIASSARRSERAAAGVENAAAPEKTEIGRGILVKAGDTLWNIAAKYLGRGEKWRELAAGNPQLANPAKIQIGAWVRLPDDVEQNLSSQQNDAEVVPAVPAKNVAPGVTVVRGDSLWKVAQVKLGNGAAWKCVAHANREIRNSNLIFPGQALTIPTSCDRNVSQIAALSPTASPTLSSAFSRLAAQSVQAVQDAQ